MTTISIKGTTRLYGIIGDPIAQVKSPELFSGRFADDRIDAVMLPMHVPSDRFEAIVPALKQLVNLDGLIFTVSGSTAMHTGMLFVDVSGNDFSGNALHGIFGATLFNSFGTACSAINNNTGGDDYTLSTVGSYPVRAANCANTFAIVAPACCEASTMSKIASD